ncbi:MAG: MMPL family transporter, partial [Thermoplasmata archaeon]
TSYLQSQGFNVSVGSILNVENDTLRSFSLGVKEELSSIYRINSGFYDNISKLNNTLSGLNYFVFYPPSAYLEAFNNHMKNHDSISSSEYAAYSAITNSSFTARFPGPLIVPYINSFTGIWNKTFNSNSLSEALSLMNLAVNKTISNPNFLDSSGKIGPFLLSIDQNLSISNFTTSSSYYNFLKRTVIMDFSNLPASLVSFARNDLNLTPDALILDVYNLSVNNEFYNVANLGINEIYNGTIYTIHGSPLITLNMKTLRPYLLYLNSSSNVNESVNTTLKSETFNLYPIVPSAYIYHSFVGYGNTTVLFMFNLNKNYTVSQMDHVDTMASEVARVVPEASYYSAGTAVLDQQIEQEAVGGLMKALIIGIIISIVIVGIFFRSPIAAFLPFSLFLMSAVITSSIDGLFYKYILHSQISFITPTLLLILLLGLTSDYVVYIMARYRREIMKDHSDAVGETSKWAGHAVFTSGITVALSYVVLYLFDVPIFSDAGITNAVGVVISIMLANTFLIAILSRFKKKVFWPHNFEKIPFEGSMEKISHFVVKNKMKITIIFVIVAVFAAYFYMVTPTNMDVFGLVPASSGIQAVQVAASSFHGDMFFMGYVVMHFESPLNGTQGYNMTEMKQVESVESELSNYSQVAKVYGPTYPYGYPMNITALPSKYSSQYSSKISTYIGKDPHYAVIEFELSNLSWSQSSSSFVNQVPSIIGTVAHSDYTYYVGGLTAGLDAAYSHTLKTFEEIIPILAVSIFAILLIQLSSLYTPIRLILMVLASVLIGLSLIYVIVYYFYRLPIIIFMPMFTFITLLAVGLDYDIFMITRAREGVIKGMNDEEAIRASITENGGIIITLGSLLFATFGSLYFSSLQIIQEIGGGLALGVLVDTFLSWPFFVPAVMLLMKKYNWWPSKIGKT